MEPKVYLRLTPRNERGFGSYLIALQQCRPSPQLAERQARAPREYPRENTSQVAVLSVMWIGPTLRR
ncbi:hypothetical protein AAFF_G00021530 [Aldrovandia affinis]|uniref:Uncharacterized protein n=1 Tax=Aldrovandia affinis TaxID=143900 RepID=A0AAD7S519_9TELE|nr:hypothetical protein AAFF_G00021530 [Aldrovandia affinis]